MKSERKKQIREKYQKETEKYLSGILRKLKFDKAANRLLIWAETNRKGMFAITISFLLLVVCVSIFFRPKQGLIEVYAKEKKLSEDSIKIHNPVSNIKFNAAMELVKVQQEIAELQCKEKLSPDDSLKIKELFQKLKTYKINNK